jgi:TPP-dependent pyruvate/acetoin dehydrogenase alpha subunit
MGIDLWSLYRQMLKSRLFEEAVGDLWEKGLISGEMHMGLGEEAIVAGVLDHLIEGDALALDHRGTPPMLMCGVDPVSLLRELMGCSSRASTWQLHQGLLALLALQQQASVLLLKFYAREIYQ